MGRNKKRKIWETRVTKPDKLASLIIAARDLRVHDPVHLIGRPDDVAIIQGFGYDNTKLIMVYLDWINPNTGETNALKYIWVEPGLLLRPLPEDKFPAVHEESRRRHDAAAAEKNAASTLFTLRTYRPRGMYYVKR